MFQNPLSDQKAFTVKYLQEGSVEFYLWWLNNWEKQQIRSDRKNVVNENCVSVREEVLQRQRHMGEYNMIVVLCSGNVNYAEFMKTMGKFGGNVLCINSRLK